MQTQDQLIFRHDLKAGDIGKLIMYAGIYSNADFGYPLAFEGYVAKTFAEYIINPQPKDRIWIVEESDGKFVGSVAVLDRGRLLSCAGITLIPNGEEKASEREYLTRP